MAKRLMRARSLTAALVTAAAMATGALLVAQSRVLVAGTKTVTALPVALSSGPCVEVLIQNDPTSGSGALAIGDANGQYVALTAGSSMTLAIDDLSTVYVKAVNTTGPQIVNWLCRKN